MENSTSTFSTINSIPDHSSDDSSHPQLDVHRPLNSTASIDAIAPQSDENLAIIQSLLDSGEIFVFTYN
jgi:hypothetical protein